MSFLNRSTKEDKVRRKVKRMRAELDEKLACLDMIYADKVEIHQVGPEWLEINKGLNVKELLPKRLHETSTITMVDAKKNARVNPHYHTEQEWIYVLSGKLQIKMVGDNKSQIKVLKMGQVLNIPAYQVHDSLFMEDTIAIMQWIPKL